MSAPAKWRYSPAANRAQHDSVRARIGTQTVAADALSTTTTTRKDHPWGG